MLRQADRHASALSRTLIVCQVARDSGHATAVGDLVARVREATGRGPGEITLMSAVGIPADEILRIIDERRPELVVLGAPRHGRWQRLIRGCTVDRVVHDSNVPVLVARPSPHSRQIVVATDLADWRFPVIEVASQEARLFDARVVALHCLEPWPMYGARIGAEYLPPRISARARLARDTLDSALQRFAIAAEPRVIVGAATEAILDAADQYDAELVVVGQRQRSAWARFVEGSVSPTVIRRAPCSVMVVPIGIPGRVIRAPRVVARPPV